MKIKSSIYNENKIMQRKNEMKQLENSKIPLEEYEGTIIESEVIDEEKKCESGWYILYYDNFKKVYHDKCKGSKEGWNSSTYAVF